MEEKKIVGHMQINGSVDITDPCYDRDVWCRINDMKVRPGDYECSYFMTNFPWEYDGKNGDDWCVTRARIAHVDVMTELESTGFSECDEAEEIGEIGVDAGLAGFFKNKPDFSDEEWHEFCRAMRAMRAMDEQAYLTDLGFWTSSGYGDGGYPVYAVKRGGEIVALEIVFIA